MPSPQFYVFYNGRESTEEISEMKLEDAFSDPNPVITLKVKAFDIRYERNSRLLHDCQEMSTLFCDILSELPRIISKCLSNNFIPKSPSVVIQAILGRSIGILLTIIATDFIYSILFAEHAVHEVLSLSHALSQLKAF